MPALPGNDSRIELGGDVALVAPGVRGRVERHDARGDGDEAMRAEEVAGATPTMRRVLDDAGLVTLHVVEVDVEEVDRSPDATGFRAATGEPGMVLEVPDLGPEVGQVVLAVDEHGAATWVFPTTSPTDGTPAPTTRGTGDTLRFTIRTTVPPPPPPDAEGDPTTRGLLGRAGRKVLEVIAWRVGGDLVAMTARALAKKFEDARRPIRVRTFLPGEQRRGEPATPVDWDRLASGPSLWFVHGTFSTAPGGFGGLDDGTLKRLHDAYDGRVVAFDHHTLSVTPAEDVTALAGLVPEGTRFDADLVSHSRGGLVARALAGEGLDDEGDTPLSVRKVVTVATPHHGTVLADPEHVTAFLDRVTTLLNLAPDGFVVADALATVLDVVKLVLAKGLAALPGLEAMDPDGESLTAFNSSGMNTGIELHAIASDHEPKGPMRSLLMEKIADALVDRIFLDAANDVVVPTDGAWRGSDGPLFPVHDDRLLLLDRTSGVMHGTYFIHDEVRTTLVRWLT